MSFPVTGLSEGKKKEVDDFKGDVSTMFIGFDPLALEERWMVTTADSLSKELDEDLNRAKRIVDELSNAAEQKNRNVLPFWDSWSALGLARVKVEDFYLLGRQLISVLEAIDSQIISRDFLLIDQSDFVLMYIRVGEDGTPQISAGSQSEMLYAYSQGKPVYVVCPGGRRQLSPWVTQFSEVFETLPAAFEFLAKRYPNNHNNYSVWKEAKYVETVFSARQPPFTGGAGTPGEQTNASRSD